MKPNQDETDPSDFRVKLLTQEIQFAKMLAGNEFNTAIKEKHIKKLGTWLKNRTACSQGTLNSIDNQLIDTKPFSFNFAFYYFVTKTKTNSF